MKYVLKNPGVPDHVVDAVQWVGLLNNEQLIACLEFVGQPDDRGVTPESSLLIWNRGRQALQEVRMGDFIVRQPEPGPGGVLVVSGPVFDAKYKIHNEGNDA